MSLDVLYKILHSHIQLYLTYRYAHNTSLCFIQSRCSLLSEHLLWSWWSWYSITMFGTPCFELSNRISHSAYRRDTLKYFSVPQHETWNSALVKNQGQMFKRCKVFPDMPWQLWWKVRSGYFLCCSVFTSSITRLRKDNCLCRSPQLWNIC